MYNAEYFLDRCKAIDASQWTARLFIDSEGRRCAIGQFCDFRQASNGAKGMMHNEISRALVSLFSDYGLSVVSINDTQRNLYGFNQETPKERIVAALEYIISVQKDPSLRRHFAKPPLKYNPLKEFYSSDYFAAPPPLFTMDAWHKIFEKELNKKVMFIHKHREGPPMKFKFPTSHIGKVIELRKSKPQLALPAPKQEEPKLAALSQLGIEPLTLTKGQNEQDTVHDGLLLGNAGTHS